MWPGQASELGWGLLTRSPLGSDHRLRSEGRDDLQGIQRVLSAPSGCDVRDAVGRIARLESWRQSVRDRRLAGGGAELHFQGDRRCLRDAQGRAGLAAGTIPCVSRLEMDPALRT